MSHCCPNSNEVRRLQTHDQTFQSTRTEVRVCRMRHIRTLLFAGMNTDQCLMATLQDAHSRDPNTIVLRDACATDSPGYAQQSAEFNCCINWGFLTSCKALATAAGIV
ncbi:hypothetical protein B0T17DRAFT_544339 [Bombardia bombarda]|uniref:Isochorismatase-like domain-containing protein n=1 Tax=Bombardia bombarda TaxID=252184 RepID=A0AA39T0Z8_9PEZI|nr:hypothetical protein B0T17DRAFT_544339 [Bombardia bombarda]